MPEIQVNRAPFLTLWAAVVARRVGYTHEESLTLGRAVAGQTAAAKATRLGIAGRRPAAEREGIAAQQRQLGAEFVHFMGRVIPCLRTEEGLRALAGTVPTAPTSVERYLATKFKDHLRIVEEKLSALAAAYEAGELDAEAMRLYMEMRPVTDSGKAGWGQTGRLDLDAVDRLLVGRAE